ncbi:MAG: hypothetical protein ACR2QE_16545 [Acidimicrobiales bacterium]
MHLARRVSMVVATAALVLTACGGSTDANDHISVSDVGDTTGSPPTTASAPPVARATGTGDLDPINPVEWHLIGQWTVETVDEETGSGLAGTIGDRCEFADDHILRCERDDRSATLTGLWLADALPAAADDNAAVAVLTWRSDDGQRGGSARVTLSGDELVMASGFHESGWTRTASLPRGERPDPAPSRLQVALTGTWEMTDLTDTGSALLEQMAVGTRCELLADRTFVCRTDDRTLNGVWRVQRGIAGQEQGGLAPRLSLTTSDGFSATTTFTLPGLDELHLTGSAASSWVAVD